MLTGYPLEECVHNFSCNSNSCDSACSDLDEMDDQLERHKALLEDICRLCGQQFKDRPSSKSKFGAGFQFFKIKLHDDDPYIHPPYVCDNHRRLLQTVQKKIESNRSYSTNFKPVTFNPHCASCNICFTPELDHAYVISKAVSKKRKVNPGPGRGVKGPLQGAAYTHQPPDTAQIEEKESDTEPDRIISEFADLQVEDQRLCIDKLICSLNSANLSYMAFKLGESQCPSMYSDALSLSLKYKNLTELVSYNVDQFLYRSNHVVKSFLRGCCKLDETDQRKSYLFGITMEMLLKLRYPSLIAPLSFMRNLTAYIGHDRSVIMKVNGASSPGGSYTTVTTWVKELQAPPTECPVGDVICVFDNDQVVGKTYKVSPHNKVKCSIITNCMWIQADPNGTLQADESLMPGRWLGEENEEAVLKMTRKMRLDNTQDPLFHDSDLAHREQMAYFLDRAISEVKEEQHVDTNGLMSDLIDSSVKAMNEAQVYQVCPACQSLVLRTKRNCTNPDCGVNIRQARESQSADETVARDETQATSNIHIHGQDEKNVVTYDDRYGHIPHHHPDQPPVFVVADPVYCNPNSYESLTRVLRKIGTEAGIRRYGGNKRAWVIVCCDGLPYHLCMKLIQQSFVCIMCKETFFGSDAITKHVKKDCLNSTCYREFDWVLLKMGGGHVEMNMIKSFMELNWVPFMSDLCSTLSFRSPLAQQSAKRCDDHHKSWAMIVTFFLASIKELVMPYVRSCIEDGEDATPAGFINYASSKRNVPNFSFMYDQVMKYSLAIITFRMGTRRNNSRLIRSAKYIFNNLFHGRKHPIYALIDINDALIFNMAPAPVKKFLATHESFNKSANNKSKGQDADFLLEEVNKETKSWIPRGVPDDRSWQMVCRNLSHLQSMKKKMEELTGVPNKRESGYRELDVDAGVYAWRCRLREKEYLTKADPLHTTITGDKLHKDLSSFRLKASGKRANHISAVFDDEVPYDTTPVFVTDSEAKEAYSIEKQLVPDIKKRINHDIHTLEGDDSRKYFSNKLKVSKRKADLVQLYYELQKFYTEQGVVTMIGVALPDEM